MRKPFSRVLARARRLGYLRLAAGETRERALEEAWLRCCLAEGRPYLTLSLYRKNDEPYIELELHAPWWLSKNLHQQLGAPEHEGGRRLGWCLDDSTTAHARCCEILRILNAHRPRDAERFDQPRPLLEGWARCIDTRGLQDCLALNEHCVIREIAGMHGHVEAWLDGKPPLVGVHLGRFELLSEAVDD